MSTLSVNAPVQADEIRNSVRKCRSKSLHTTTAAGASMQNATSQLIKVFVSEAVQGGR